MPPIIIILTEELSIKEFLEVFIEKNFPCINFRVFAHRGYTHLQKEMRNKLRSFRAIYQQNVQFIILHDKDDNNCIELKGKLSDLANEGDIRDFTIRIVCSELESWYLGDLRALDIIQGSNYHSMQMKEKYRAPDNLQKPSQELMKIFPAYEKVKHSKEYGRHLNISDNRSHSYNVFIATLQNLEKWVMAQRNSESHSETT